MSLFEIAFDEIRLGGCGLFALQKNSVDTFQSLAGGQLLAETSENLSKCQTLSLHK